MTLPDQEEEIKNEKYTNLTIEKEQPKTDNYIELLNILIEKYHISEPETAC